MNEKFKTLCVGSLLVLTCGIFIFYTRNSDMSISKQPLGAVSLEQLNRIKGGTEVSADCIANPFKCYDAAFQFNAGCSGCVAVTDGSDPQEMLIGTYAVGNELTCGSSNMSYNYSGSVQCEAVTTCNYVKKDGYMCAAAQNINASCRPISNTDRPCPGEVCYNVSGTPPVLWTYKDGGECIDP